MYLYVGYINEATNFAESQGGGGSDTKDWGREKDEDEIVWIRRCLQKATRISLGWLYFFNLLTSY